MPKGETTNNIQRARVARTQAFFRERFAFNAMLTRAIDAHIRRAHKHGLTPTVRLNGTSDLPWERLRLSDGRTLLETYPTVQFYDYTKSLKRALANARGQHPANYHLTFSRSETNELDAIRVLHAGGNVAVVFRKALPSEFAGVPVVDGDHDDLRFLDPQGVVVGLKAKGKARGAETGFVVTA
jgi:hypothetical protein